MTGQCLYCKCRHFLRSDTDERSRISQLFSAETVVSAAAKQSCTVSMFLHRGLWVLSTLNFTECALKIDTQTQKNCCSENLTLNLQTIFQKCESTNPSHSHSRLWSINLYGHRDGTQTPRRKALNQTRKLFCCEVTMFTAAPLRCPFTRPHISFNYSAEDWLSLVFNTWVWFASHRVCLVSTLPCIF